MLAARAAGLRALHLDRLGAGPSTERERRSSLVDLVDYLTDNSVAARVTRH